jgi:hypothetical protein
MTDAAQVPLWAEQVELFFRLSRAATGSDGALYGTAPVIVQPDANGEIVVRLVPNDEIQGNSSYRVSAKYLDRSGKYTEVDLWQIFVPKMGGWISELIDPSWSPAQMFYGPTRPEPWPKGTVWQDTITGDNWQNTPTGLVYLGNMRGPRGPEGAEGPEGKPGVNAVPAQDAVAAYLASPSSPVNAATRDIIDKDRKTFDLAKARIEYGARAMRPPSENRVMQSVQVVARLGGEIWYSQVAAGTTGGRESTVVVRCTAAGAYLGEMVFVDAGHGTGMFVEADSSGTPWVWLSFTNHAVASGAGRFNYVRVPWAAGASRTWADVASFKVTALSRATYVTAHYDEYNDEIGVRDNPASGGYQFSRHSMAAIKAGTWNPQDVMSYTPGGDWYGQGWALLDRVWYLMTGNGSTYSPYFPIQIWQLDSVGARVFVKDLESIRRSPVGPAVGGFTEPEGLAAARGPKGEPSLMLGISAGPTGGRSYTFWSVHMGVDPFVNQRYAQDGAWGETGWTDTVVETWNSPTFTPNTTALQKFEGRIIGGYLELDGVINGTFTPGSNAVGKMRAGYYSPTKQRRGVAVKSMSGASPSAAVRVEINTAGDLSVFMPFGEASVSFIDLTGFRVPLFIERGVSYA